MFVCTHVEKRVTVDNWQNGCDVDSRCVMLDAIDIAADSMQALILAIGEQFDLALETVWIPEFPAGRIGYNRLETETGGVPTAAEMEAWKHGKEALYLADYDFLIERRETSDVDESEFAGVAFHQ